MPLLGKRIFDGVAAPPVEEQSKTYVIPHTKEVFCSEAEFQERLKLYEKNIWTCQCTGHINLTHQNAMKSEKECRDKLGRTFQQVWEEPVLKLIQHSFAPLDSLIQEAQKLLSTQLVVEEKVIFTVKPGKTFEATIVKCHNGAEHKTMDNSLTDNKPTSSSPSSDKENKGRQTLITDIFKSDMRRSPRCTGSINPNAPLAKGKKYTLLPYQYDILLCDENKIVSRVPCEHLTRTQKPPNRELIRLFIRANAFRPTGVKEKMPWIVDENMVFRYSLKPIIPSTEEKRMLELVTVTSEQYAQELEEASRPPPQPHVNGVTMNGNSSDNDTSLADLFSTAMSKSEVQKRKSSASPLSSAKRSKGEGKTKSDKKPLGMMDHFLKKGAFHKIADYVKDEADPVAANDESMSCIVIDDNSPVKNKPSSSRKSSSPRKKKQATLLEMTKKGGIKLLASRTPSKSRLSTSNGKLTPRKLPQPIIVRQLLSLKKEKAFRSHKYKMTVTTACKILTKKQLANLPPEIKDDILKRLEVVQLKKKYESMTKEERREFMKEQRKKRQGRQDGSGQFEDQDLVRTSVAKALPKFRLVALSDCLANRVFGDVVMICEFLYAYHALLAPKDPSYHKQFTTTSIIEAVTSGKKGFGLTSRIIVLLLQTLLTDDIAKDYSELEYKLNQIHVTPEVCCDLIRICLRQHDEDADETKEDEEELSLTKCDTGLSPSTSRRLFEVEIYDLEAGEQVEVLATLIYRVMNTYAVQLHMEHAAQKAASVWHKVVKHTKEIKENEKNKKAEENANPEVADNASAESPVKEDEGKIENIDLISRVKSRRVLSEQHRREEEEKKRKLQEERDRRYEEEKRIQEAEKTSRMLAESRAYSRIVRRCSPLGTDRNHDRYWLFCDGAPGFYIEKGWASESIDYSTMPDVTENAPTTPRKSPTKAPKPPVPGSPTKNLLTSDDDDVPLSQLATPKKARFRKSKEERTWPKAEENVWMSIDSQEELDALLNALCLRGIRESKLHRILKSKYESIVKSINKMQAQRQQQQSEVAVRRSALPSDGDELHVTVLRKRLTTMVNEACQGGISTLSEPDVFQQRIALAESTAEFSNLLLDIHSSIPPGYLKQYMTGISDKKKQADDSAQSLAVVKAERRVSRWRRAVEESSLLSRLSLLLTILNNTIKWELYQYKRSRTNRRAATQNKSYADLNNGVVSDDEEEEEEEEEVEDAQEEESNGEVSEEEEDDDDGAQRRSSRLRAKHKRTEPVSTRRVLRKRTSNFRNRTSSDSSNDEESDEEEENSNSDASEDESDQSVEDDPIGDCRNIIEKLMRYQYSEYFRDPVDIVEVPDYYDVVEHPICMNDILENIEAARKSSQATEDVVKQMMQDMRVLLDNALDYNGQDSYVTKQSKKLEQGFVRCCRDLFTAPCDRTRLRRMFECG